MENNKIKQIETYFCDFLIFARTKLGYYTYHHRPNPDASSPPSYTPYPPSNQTT